jgi:hypothetical protein
MRLTLAFVIISALGLTATPRADAQAARKGTSPGLHRTLTGTITAIEAGDSLVTVGLDGETTTKAGQNWDLKIARQTLMLRAGRNNQFVTIDLADLKKGDKVQAVVALQANPSDKAHAAWWLVVYPTGTTPPEH